MALNFPDPGVSTTYVVDGVTYNYNGTKGYWSTSSIDAGGGTPNDSAITLSPGTGLIGGGTFTTNQSFNETITFDIDLNELTTSTADGDGDYFVVVDTSGNERKLTKANINLSGFNNDSGFTTNAGTVTSVGVSAGTGLSGGGTVTSSGTISLAVSLSELTDMTATMVGTDEFIVLDASADHRKAANEIGLSIFNNDAGFITSADGGNAATLDSIDSSQFLRSDTADTATGNLIFSGSIRVNGTLLDAGGGAGTSGQILSSTGTGVDWIDAPSGGASAINDLTDVTITSPSSGQVLKYNGSAWVNGTDETSAGGSGITTGKAIAMAMVFG